MKLTKAQRTGLEYAVTKLSGRVPPYLFRDHRSRGILLDTGLIEYWIGYGAPMYRITQVGREAVEPLVIGVTKGPVKKMNDEPKK